MSEGSSACSHDLVIPKKTTLHHLQKKELTKTFPTESTQFLTIGHL